MEEVATLVSGLKQAGKKNETLTWLVDGGMWMESVAWVLLMAVSQSVPEAISAISLVELAATPFAPFTKLNCQKEKRNKNLLQSVSLNLSHEFHETCHSVTFTVLVNSHQR